MEESKHTVIIKVCADGSIIMTFNVGSTVVTFDVIAAEHSAVENPSQQSEVYNAFC